MTADTKSPVEHVKDVVNQLKEMHHYAKNNVERLTAQWMLFDGELKKLKQTERIAAPNDLHLRHPAPAHPGGGPALQALLRRALEGPDQIAPLGVRVSVLLQKQPQAVTKRPLADDVRQGA